LISGNSGDDAIPNQKIRPAKAVNSYAVVAGTDTISEKDKYGEYLST